MQVTHRANCCRSRRHPRSSVVSSPSWSNSLRTHANARVYFSAQRRQRRRRRRRTSRESRRCRPPSKRRRSRLLRHHQPHPHPRSLRPHGLLCLPAAHLHPPSRGQLSLLPRHARQLVTRLPCLAPAPLLLPPLLLQPLLQLPLLLPPLLLPPLLLPPLLLPPLLLPSLSPPLPLPSPSPPPLLPPLPLPPPLPPLLPRRSRQN